MREGTFCQYNVAVYCETAQATVNGIYIRVFKKFIPLTQVSLFICPNINLRTDNDTSSLSNMNHRIEIF